MEKPPANMEQHSSSESSANHPNGQLPESSTVTANSTPTMTQSPPRCRDFVEEDEEGDDGDLQKGSEMQPRSAKHLFDAEKASVRQRESVASFGSVNIADSMTVPPAEHFHSVSDSSPS